MKADFASSQAMRFVAIALFIVLPVAFFAISTLNLIQIDADRAATVETEAQTETLLARMRASPLAATGRNVASIFVSGTTKTSALAGLQQRVLDTISSVSGKVIETAAIASPSPEEVQDRVEVTTTLDIDNQGLLQLLYALETGVPFVWIDTLSVRGLPDNTAEQSGLLRVEITVSARWPGAKT